MPRAPPCCSGAATSTRSCPSSRGSRRSSGSWRRCRPPTPTTGSPRTTARWPACCRRAARRTAAAGGPRERYLAFELVRALLDDVAGRRPVLLVLDDVHWADADSLSLLRHLARAAAAGAAARGALRAPGTSSSRPIAQTLADLRREGPLVHVDLAGLDEDAVAALLARRTGAADGDGPRRYRARSGGNPFFLDELLREAQERGARAAGPPAGVREVIARRLARLDDATLRALEVAAVAGSSSTSPTLARRGRPARRRGARGARRGDRRRPRRRDRPARALRVRPRARAPRRSSPRCRPRAARGCTCRSPTSSPTGTTPARRAPATSPGTCAPPGRCAGAERVARWELAAAREASAALAHADAAAHYEAALAARPGARTPSAARSCSRSATRTTAPAARAGPRRVRRGRRRSPARPATPDLLARAALGHGGTALVIAAADADAVRLLEEALAAARRATRRPRRACSRACRSSSTTPTPPGPASSATAPSRPRGARAIRPRSRRPSTPRASRCGRPHHADERLAVAGEMIAAAEAAGDREAVLQARNWRVVDLLELGRVARGGRGDRRLRGARRRRRPARTSAGTCRSGAARSRMLAGRWDEARRADGAGARARTPGRRPERPALRRDPAPPQPLRPAAHRRDGPQRGSSSGAAASPAAAEWLVQPGADRRRDRRDARTRAAWSPSSPATAAARWPWTSTGTAPASWPRRPCSSATARPARRCTRCSSRTRGCSRSSPGRSRASARPSTTSGASPASSAATTRPRPACAARWPRTTAPAPGPTRPLALLRLGETLAAARRADAARDVLQQAAQRAEALDMPALAADAGRLLGATVA